MKHRLKIYLFLVALIGATTGIEAGSSCNSCDFGATPYFRIRSQSVDSARELVGWANDYHINLYQICNFYWTGAATFEYTKSLKSDHISRCLFGNTLAVNCDCPTIKISGSHVENRGNADWLAEYFGLAPDFQSTITLQPEVRNYLVDFDFYFGLDQWVEGLYFRIHAPVVHTHWDLGAKEIVQEKGVQGYEAGYFASEAISRDQLNDKALDFFSGKNFKFNGLDNVTIERLKNSRWAVNGNCSSILKETKFSDVIFALGWNFLLCEDYHLGLNIRGSAPIGTKPGSGDNGCFLFQPVIGNGHHWEAGAGLTSHAILWRDCNCDRYFGVYLDANITHLFKTGQYRDFDLCNGPNSRYALAMKLGTPILDGLRGNSDMATADIALPLCQTGPTGGYTEPSAQFKNTYTPIANLTRLKVDVSSSIQTDITLLFDYTSCGFSWDIGYNFWGIGCEKIQPDCDCPTTIKENTWAVKGDALVYGFPVVITNCPTGINTGVTGATPVALSASESLASIIAGTNRPCGEAYNDPTQRRNPGIDNPQFAYTDLQVSGAATGVLTPLLSSPDFDRSATTLSSLIADQTQTSIDPIFFGDHNVDRCGAQTKGTSHSFFTNFSYTWNETACGWIPYLGVGGKVEVANRNNDDCRNTECPVVPATCPTGATVCTTSCDISCDPCETSSFSCDSCCGSCRRCALSQWGVWFKGGVSFH